MPEFINFASEQWQITYQYIYMSYIYTINKFAYADNYSECMRIAYEHASHWAQAYKLTSIDCRRY